MRPTNVPLHVRSRVFVGHDRLMSTIDYELQKTSDACALSACDVVLTGNSQAGYRAAVALELEGGRCISQSVASGELRVAIQQAFVACRAQVSAE